MRALTKQAAGRGSVALDDRPRRRPGPGQVALAVSAAGICGTDLHIEAGEYPSVPPMAMGHEVCGVVDEVGVGVDEALLGSRVVSETFYSTCGRCTACRDGRPNMCPDRQSIGTHVDGAFAPWLIVPAHGLHAAPAGLSDAAATLAEPLACVCNSLFERSRLRAGDEVLVLGPGAIGILAAQAARAAGCRVQLRGTPRDEARLALARELGFETSLTDLPYSGDAPDVVIECSGSGPGIAEGLSTCRRMGSFVQIGLRGAEVTVPFDEICFRELVVTSGFATTPAAWRRALRLMHAGSVELEALVSEVVALGDWSRAFAASRDAKGVKFVLDPREEAA